MGYLCGEAEPGFQIRLVFPPDTPDDIREAMNSQAEYWMEILRDTEAPDVFGEWLCHRPDWHPSIPVIDDIVVRVRFDYRRNQASLCGIEPLLRHRIPYMGLVSLSESVTQDIGRLEIVARHELGHVLGIGTLWRIRGQLKNRSTAEDVRDTYVLAPLAERAFDAAGGSSYAGPKVPLHQYGDGSRNSHWRFDVFGPELMAPAAGAPTSGVTLQALADLGYKVDLSLADPYTLPGATAAAAFGADESPPFELGWEAPPTIVLCHRRYDPLPELEVLSPGLLLRHARSGSCQPAQATSSSSRSFAVPTPKALPSKIQVPRPPDS